MIDHLVYATPDLDATVDDVAARLAVRPVPGGRHPSLGTRNALLGLGGATYLEIIGVDRADPGADAPTPPGGPRPFGLDHLTVARLATWAARVEGIDERVAAARAAGYDPGPVMPLSRHRPDGVELHWRLTPPSAEAIELVPFLIEWGPDTPHPSTTSPSGCRLVEFGAGHPDPDRVGADLRALGLDLPVAAAAAPALRAVIEGPGGTAELR